MQNIYFFILLSICILVSIFLQFSKALTRSPIAIFFKCSKLEKSFPKKINIQVFDATKMDSLALHFEKSPT